MGIHFIHCSSFRGRKSQNFFNLFFWNRSFCDSHTEGKTKSVTSFVSFLDVATLFLRKTGPHSVNLFSIGSFLLLKECSFEKKGFVPCVTILMFQKSKKEQKVPPLIYFNVQSHLSQQLNFVLFHQNLNLNHQTRRAGFEKKNYFF